MPMRKMSADRRQAGLFDLPTRLPHGLVYQRGLSHGREAALLAAIAPLPFREQSSAVLRQTARRSLTRTTRALVRFRMPIHFRWPLPPFLSGLKPGRRVGRCRSRVVRACHQRVSSRHADRITATSRFGHCRRCFAGRIRADALAAYDGRFVARHLVLDSRKRSAYVMQGPIRWEWQHSMLATRMLRYSITFRTRASSGPLTAQAGPMDPCERE